MEASLLNKISGYDKISKLLKNNSFSEFSYFRKIQLENSIIDNTLQTNITIELAKTLSEEQTIGITFIKVSKFIFPVDNYVQITGLMLEETKNGWENGRYRAFNIEQDSDFEIICKDIVFEAL